MKTFFFSSRRRHTRYWRDWSSDVCSSDLGGYLKGIGKPNLEEGVKKVGRTTELTVGKISAIYATYVLKYNDKDVLFKDQIFTTDMADYGDSGAILVDYKNYALGLLMAGSESFTIYNDIYNVLDNLKVNILSK